MFDEEEKPKTLETDLPEVKEPVVSVKRSPRDIRRQALHERVNMLKPKIQKLYKHKGFPTTVQSALTAERILRNLGMDEKDKDLLRAVGIAWHELADEKKVASHQMYKPLDAEAEKLPF